MNLQNLNLVELNVQEVQEVDGGVVGIDDLLLWGGALFIGGIIADWDGFKAGITGN